MASNAQVLTLRAAIDSALGNYGTLKAKSDYLRSAQALEKNTSLQYLPDIGLGAENVYGTANGAFGALYPGKVPAAASGGPVFPNQNWNSAFGALYLANVNWDFFTFGKVKAAQLVAKAQVTQGTQDLEQEKFQHQVRVAAAYLNLLAAQRIRLSQQKNLDRAIALRTVVVARTTNGLNAGVDSSLANAEVSNARTTLNNSIIVENELNSQLAQLMGIPDQPYLLDTVFLAHVPTHFNDTTTKLNDHPLLKYYQSRIDASREQEHYYNRSILPVLSAFGVIQARGSGFGKQYSVLNPNDYNHDLWGGIKPTTGNYVVGLGLTWNVMSPFKLKQQVAAQQFTSRGLENELELVSKKLRSQMVLADQNIVNALSNFREAPIQWKAASDAYQQKSTLYANGLTNMVDLTQTLYALNRAETNQEIANSNVWQALLFKAAATGDFTIFFSQL
jgi:outer membrane protein TolC